MPAPALPVRRSRFTVAIALGWAICLFGSLSGGGAAFGQSAIRAAIERRGPVSPDKRAELYGQLRSQAEILEAQAAVVKTVAKLVGPTVVHIEADVTGRTAMQYGRAPRVEEAGSGVIIQSRDQYYVLTNRHVICGTGPQKADVQKIKIHLADGRVLQADRVWEHRDTDVAVMAISESDLVAAPIGDSRAAEIGDFVLAVGSPFGLSYSVTYGIISAKGRRGLELGRSGVPLQNFLQTDAAINPGNSGGPLINLRGEVIGINTAIASNSGGSEGIGFAIPIHMFMFVASQLIERGEVRWAYLGVTLDPEFGSADAAKLGIPSCVGTLVSRVTAGSPAAAAKLLPGDVILQIGDTLIEDDSHLVDVMQLTEAGKQVPVVVFRDGKEVPLQVTLGNWGDFNK
jgi:serine protease Do